MINVIYIFVTPYGEPPPTKLSERMLTVVNVASFLEITPVILNEVLWFINTESLIARIKTTWEHTVKSALWFPLAYNRKVLWSSSKMSFITFIFDRWHRSLASVTPNKYDYGIWKVNHIL